MGIPYDKYGGGPQRVSKDTPIEDMIMLLKRDGGVIIEKFVSPESIDESYRDILPRMERDKKWKGKFFPVSVSSNYAPSPYHLLPPVDILYLSISRAH